MLSTDEEFWGSSLRLKYIFDTARSRRAAPWAVLLCTLARVAVATPPNVVLPAFVGSMPGTLNTFVAIVGKSGDGKGIAAATARSLIPDLLDASTALPVSGEGLPTLFVKREAAEDEGGKHGSALKYVNMRALLDVSEIAELGGAMERKGSTLSPVLTKLWSGEAIGGQNKNEAARLRVPEYAYRIGLIAGVQPGNSDKLTREDTTGLPQRFLWADTLDVKAPTGTPPVPDGVLGFDAAKLKAVQPGEFDMNGLYEAGDYLRYKNERGKSLYPLRKLKYPECVGESVNEDAVNRLHGSRPEGMDGHSLYLAIKVAGLLTILEQREGAEFTVTVDDWDRANYIVSKSIQAREQCIEAAKAGRVGKMAADMTARDEAAEQAAKKRAGQIRKRIITALNKHDPGYEGLKGWKIKRLFAVCGG